MSKAYSGHCQIPEMERFAKIVNSFTLLIVFAKQLILDILRGSKCASESIQPSVMHFCSSFLQRFFANLSAYSKCY